MRTQAKNRLQLSILVACALAIGATTAVADPVDFNFRQGPTEMVVPDLTWRSFHSTLTNTGDLADTYTVTVTRTNPEDWFFNVCYDGACFPAFDVVSVYTVPVIGSVEPGGEVVFDFDVTSGEGPGTAQLEVEIVSNQDGSVQGSWTFDVRSPEGERDILFAAGEGVLHAEMIDFVQFHPRFYNAGLSEDTYTWSIEQHLPNSGWTTAFCYDDGCYTELSGQFPYGGVGTIPSGGEVAIDLDFTVTEAAESGYVILTIVSDTDPTLWSSATYMVVTGSVVGVDDVPDPRLSGVQAVPNPFNPRTEIRFNVGGTGSQDVVIDIYDATGRQVRTLTAGDLAPGPQSLAWDGRTDDGRPLAAGVYLANVRAGTAHESVKMSLVK
jgi:hypothetical protein